ncbi:MAG: V-type ATP synthase subunit E, partial [Anaerolineales bacterium]
VLAAVPPQGPLAERLTELACEKALEPASHERARLIHRARLEAMQTVGEARKELVDAALEQVRGRLVNLRTDACYPDVLRQLLLEALAELDEAEQDGKNARSGSQICLEASPDDQVLLESVLRSLELDLPVSYSLNCWGGVVAKGENGKIVVINTLEARLERAVPYLRIYLAAFFEHQRTAADYGQTSKHLKVMETQIA